MGLRPWKRRSNAAIVVCANDRVLAHDEVGPQHLAVDPQSDAVNGFDDSAADRHPDCHCFDIGREARLDAAVEIDGPASGRAIEMALYGRRPGVQRGYGLRPETGSQILAENIRVPRAVAKGAR